MPDLSKIQVQWSGFKGEPGISTFYTTDLAMINARSALQTFFEDVSGLHPDGMVWTIPDVGVTIDESTGQINGSWSESGGELVAEADGGAYYSGSVGYVCTWHTHFYAGGREVKGRTFMVPTTVDVWDTNGTLKSDSRETARAAADQLAVSANIVVYSPTNSASAVAVSGTVADEAAVMRSRRS